MNPDTNQKTLLIWLSNFSNNTHYTVCKRKRKRLVRQKIEKMFHYSIFTLKPKSKKNFAIQSEHLFLFCMISPNIAYCRYS